MRRPPGSIVYQRNHVAHLRFHPHIVIFLRLDSALLVAGEFGNKFADKLAFFFGGDVAAVF